ncbi:MAG: anti-sigma F factor antagonist [Bacillota bacterium]|jgi:stage II sporulation protein AA (anti-sigma F factor antagonist)
METRGDTLVVVLEGELDLRVADELRKKLEESLSDLPVRHLVVDLSRVCFVDSSGLGVLLGRYRRVAAAGGKVALTGAQPQVRRVLELSGLFRIMGEYPTPDKALEHIC